MASESNDISLIPVIDIFAGPGGLSEGFSAFNPAEDEHPFQVKLSIEKDALAHQTLRLRAFFRQFSEGQIPSEYYAFLRDTATPLDKRLRKLFNSHPQAAEQAKEETRLAELGVKRPLAVRQWMDQALGNSDLWVLIGGPPCQAYSLVGRSRNKGIEDYVAEDDQRQYLYVEYLQVLADHRPAVFIMENVKGLLSATLDNQRVFERICEDLQDPVKALRREHRSVRRKHRAQPTPPYRYRLFPLADYAGAAENYSLFPDDEHIMGQTDLRRFVVRMEQHGIPQARHRVIILGVREDLSGAAPGALRLTAPVGVKQVLTGLPRLRGGLSGETDSRDAWIARLREMSAGCLFQAARETDGVQLFQRLTDSLARMEQEELGRGDEFITCAPSVNYRSDWFLDPQEAEEGWSMARHRTWTNDELLVVFRLYCLTPFGRLHQRNPEIIQLARLLERTPSAVAMKACNFASLDPVQKSRNISALGNVSRADRELWNSFEQNSEALAADAEIAYEKLSEQGFKPEDVEFEMPEGPSEVERTVRARRIQGFFRAAVLTGYEFRCALSNLAIPELLNASHIIPWNANIERRADPRNGIALNALYDRAFDRGFIAFDESLRLVLSSRLKEGSLPDFQKESFLNIEGKKLRLPYRFNPDLDAMAYHREKVFRP